MKKLKCIKDILIDRVYEEVSKDLDSIDTEELGKVIDMIKDIEKSIYHQLMSQKLEEEMKMNVKTME